MHRDQYLIIFTGKRDDDWLVEDEFYSLLKDNQSALNISNPIHHFSDLTHLTISYACFKSGVLEELNHNFTYKVIKICLPDGEWKVNEDLDCLFRELISDFDEPINSVLYYMIERNGKAGFHGVSRSKYHDKITDDDPLDDIDSVIKRNPAIFYNHFSGKPYTDDQLSEIAKMILVTGGAS